MFFFNYDLLVIHIWGKNYNLKYSKLVMINKSLFQCEIYLNLIIIFQIKVCQATNTFGKRIKHTVVILVRLLPIYIRF